MKKCRNCMAPVQDEVEICPYCKSTLFFKQSDGDSNDKKYDIFLPDQEKPPQKHKAGKIILLVFIAIVLKSCVSSDRGIYLSIFNQYEQDKGLKISKKSEVSYEDIYNEYAKKIRNATPKLIEEYYAESKSNTNGIMGLATISNNKVLKLAEISNEGVMKMANHMYATQGEYSEYEEWSGKLYSVYMEESGKITSAYMSSAMGAFGY